MIKLLSIPGRATVTERSPRVSPRAGVYAKGGLFAGASAEFQLVALCCSPADGVMVASEMSRLAAVVEWKRVLRLARRHRVVGLVAKSLYGVEGVPAEMREAFARGARAIALANMSALSTLRDLREAFERASVPFVVLKGIPLGQLAYGSPVVRHSKDIDLLVEPEVMPLVEDLLASQGFRRAPGLGKLSAKQQALWQRFRKHHEFVNERTGVAAEVHWRRSDNMHLCAVPMGADRLVEVGGLQMDVASSMNLLLELCLHGAGHAWFRLKWIADVAALLAREPAGTGEQLLALARRHDVDRPVEQALLLCSSLFPGLQQARVGKPTRAGVWLARVAGAALLEEATTAASAETEFVASGLKRSRFLLRRSWRYRFEEVRVQAASPADWKTLAIPEALQFLYPLLRLPLWAKRRWWPRKRFHKRRGAEHAGESI